MYRDEMTVGEDIMEIDECTEDVVENASFRKKDAVRQIKEVLKFISDEVGCEFPKGFAAKLYEVLCGKDVFYLNKIHARGIIDEWRIWEEYVSPDDVSKFFCRKLETFCRIHCCVTYGFNRGEATAKSFIGNFVNVTKEIPDNMYTIVNSSGVVSLNGRICEVYEDDPRAAFSGMRKKRKTSFGSKSTTYRK